MIYVYPVTPVSAPRQVHRDLYNPSNHVKRYRAYRDELQLRRAFVPNNYHHLIFVLEMPRSWSAKKRAELEGQPHQSKPDRDNLEKAYLDAVLGEDSHVWDGRTTKLWGQRGLVLCAGYPLGVVLPYPLEPFYRAADLPPNQGAHRIVHLATPL